MSKIVLFVCSANICRSPMAEGLFRKMMIDKGKVNNIIIMSAGLSRIIGEPPSVNAITVMRERGIDISQHRSQQITKEMVDKATKIIVMARHHKMNLIEMFPECRDTTYLLSEIAERIITDIPDPIAMEIEKYRIVADLLERFLIEIIEKLD